MAIHYENYQRFSKGQGFIGALCRPVNPLATSKRFFATDCGECKAKLIGRRVISRQGVIGAVVVVTSNDLLIDIPGDMLDVSWKDFDVDWAPFPSIEDIFGQGE